MSLHEYQESKKLIEYPFYALIMGAMRNADSINLMKLQLAFPEVYTELLERYNAPGGVLPSDNNYIY